jgi:hypothetical protein
LKIWNPNVTRDNFTPYTKQLLGQAVGFNCVRPGCAKPVTAYDSESGSIKSISTAAHDAGAAEGGPRYDASMTPEQRKAYENGALLCPTCARLVDVDVDRFPPGILVMWQSSSADYRRQRMQMPTAPYGIDFRMASSAAQNFLELCQPIDLDYRRRSITWQSISAIEELVRRTNSLNATNELCTMFPHTVNIQQEMINAGLLAMREVRTSDFWWYDNEYKRYVLRAKNEIYPSDEEQQINLKIEASFHLVSERMKDFWNLGNDLRKKLVLTSSPSMDLYSW